MARCLGSLEHQAWPGPCGKSCRPPGCICSWGLSSCSAMDGAPVAPLCICGGCSRTCVGMHRNSVHGHSLKSGPLATAWCVQTRVGSTKKIRVPNNAHGRVAMWRFDKRAPGSNIRLCTRACVACCDRPAPGTRARTCRQHGRSAGAGPSRAARPRSALPSCGGGWSAAGR